MDSELVPPKPNHPDVDSLAPLKSLVLRIDSEERASELIKHAKGLNAEELHVLVDGLCMVLNHNAEPTPALRFAWTALIDIVSTLNVFAPCRTINSQDLSPTTDDSIYAIQGNPSKRVQVLQQAKSDEPKPCRELVHWAHLSHPNIMALYMTFFDGEDQPSFLLPHISARPLCDVAHHLDKQERIRLILDVAAGLDYMHQAGTIHGSLTPEAVLIADSGSAVITALHSRSEKGSWDLIPTRYSAPEIFEKEDALPTKAIDVWSLACFFYEIFSGKTPHSQISQETRVSVAVVRGDKPLRPGQNGNSGEEIADGVWNLLMTCWEHEAAKRPSSFQVRQALLSVIDAQGHSPSRPTVQPTVFETSAIDLEHAETILAKALSLGGSRPSNVTIPERIQATLQRLTSTFNKSYAMENAVRKLSPADTQTLVDLLDLAVKDLPPKDLDPVDGSYLARLVSRIMISTYIVPQSYKLDGLQFNSGEPIAENDWAKAYKARGANVRINVVTNRILSSSICRCITAWVNVSHPNILPFHGVFHETQNGSPRLCIVTPSLGTLRDYAPTLSQKSRLPLLSDVICGLAYLSDSIRYATVLTGDNILISNDGRALISTFFCHNLCVGGTSNKGSRYHNRFHAPFSANWGIRSFGLICYETLSQKSPHHEMDDEEAVAAIERGQLPTRPDHSEDGMDEIDDKSWNLITRCFVESRHTLSRIQRIQAMVDEVVTEDNRPPAQPYVPAPEILALRSRPNIDISQSEVLNKIQAELLRDPLQNLLKNRTKAVANAVATLEHDQVCSVVDFLDQVLKENLTISKERNRVLGVLSRIMSLTHIFPRRYELNGVKYHKQVIAAGGCGKVHRGVDPSMCIKVMTPLDTKALVAWIKEVILWAHLSHPNILPFYGVFLEGSEGAPQPCLVSPFMKNGDLRGYAPRLPQKSRLPLISDVVEGLQYLHDLGIIHGDLKGQNVLISDEGRAVITDFGTSYVKTATTVSGQLSATTLRFSPPEAVKGDKTPSKEFDIWSLGCLIYEILSKQQPYHQCKLDFQIMGKISQGELPERPGTKTKDPAEDEGSDWGWDDDFDEDCDTIDDQAWALIVRCCNFQPKDRPTVQVVRELVIDMKIWDDRPAAKPISSENISKLKSSFTLDLNGMEELLAEIQRKVDGTEASAHPPAPVPATSP